MCSPVQKQQYMGEHETKISTKRHYKPELLISSCYWTEKWFDSQLCLLSLNTRTHTSMMTVFVFWMLSTQTMLKNKFQIYLSAVLGLFPLYLWGYMCTQLKKESGLNFQFMVWELILHVDTIHHWHQWKSCGGLLKKTISHIGYCEYLTRSFETYSSGENGLHAPAILGVLNYANVFLQHKNKVTVFCCTIEPALMLT